MTCIRIDATVIAAHSDKEWAEPNFKGFGHHPLQAYCDNTAEDHIAITDAAIAALPPAFRRRLMVTVDGAGASHDLIQHLDKLARRPGYQLIYSVGWAMRPGEDRDPAGARAGVGAGDRAARPAARTPRRERLRQRARCGHARCWVEDAHVAELTGLLRHGPSGDQLGSWPATMRVFVRRERSHPGAQLTLFETQEGWRYTLWVTNRPEATKGWLGQPSSIDAAHRVHARVEDCIRTGKDAGLGRFPSHDFAINTAWLTAAMTAAVLLAWLKLLAVDGALARAEPKTLRYRVLHAAARLVRGGRRRRLKVPRTWPWATHIEHAWQRITALPQAP